MPGWLLFFAQNKQLQFAFHVSSDSSPVLPLLEHSERVPLRLRPHTQPHGQQDGRGGGDHTGQPVRPAHRRGSQREAGTHHRLPGRLQGEPAQGEVPSTCASCDCCALCSLQTSRKVVRFEHCSLVFSHHFFVFNGSKP